MEKRHHDRHRHAPLAPFLQGVLFLIAVTTFSGCAMKSTFEMARFVKGMPAEIGKRETAFRSALETPLTHPQGLLLAQLLQIDAPVDDVLSDPRYLDYMAERTGSTYTDYRTYCSVTPTPEDIASIRAAFEALLPDGTADAEMQVCLDFYFRFSERLVNDPQITERPDSTEMKTFLEDHLIRPLMEVLAQMSWAKASFKNIKIPLSIFQ